MKTNYIEIAIKLSIKGGYPVHWDDRMGMPYTSDNLDSKGNVSGGSFITFEDVFLDPDFWRCLGKAERWEETCSGALLKGFSHNQFCEDCIKAGWVNKWHRFIDSLAQGESPNDFFEQLLTKQN